MAEKYGEKYGGKVRDVVDKIDLLKVRDVVDKIDLLGLSEYKKYHSKRYTMLGGARLNAPKTLHPVIVRGIVKRRIVNDVADRKIP